MAWNTKPIPRTVGSDPVPTYFDEAADEWNPLTGNPLEPFKPLSTYKSSTNAVLSATLDTGLYGGRTVLEIWVKSSVAANFTVECSTDGNRWRVSDNIFLSAEGGEAAYCYTNAYRYIKVSTDIVSDNEIEIVASR